MVKLPPKLTLAQTPTPLQLLERLSAKYGGPRIWIKRDDLTGSILTGNKVRKLEYILYEVQRDGVDVVITCGGWNSNHCRATAFAAAQMGVKVHLVLRDGVGCQNDGNYLLSKISGAEVSLYGEKRYREELNALLEFWSRHYTSQGLKVRIIPTGGSDGTGLMGYYDASLEMGRQFQELGLLPDMVLCASGSAGTQAGLTFGFAESSIRVVGVAVCDTSDFFNKKVINDVLHWRQRYAPEISEGELVAKVIPETWGGYIGPGYGRAYPAVMETIEELAREEGILLDPVYTGKAFTGLLTEIRKARLNGLNDVVFVHTGGGFGLFPFRNQFF